jgi:hypothetical protein
MGSNHLRGLTRSDTVYCETQYTVSKVPPETGGGLAPLRGCSGGGAFGGRWGEGQ